jgi:hypothetical protein
LGTQINGIFLYGRQHTPAGWTIQVMQLGSDGRVSFTSNKAAISDPVADQNSLATRLRARFAIGNASWPQQAASVALRC